MGLDIYFDRIHREEIGYFRKVNFLVKYFEDNCNLDVDSQAPIPIYIDDVRDLYDKCNKVLENHDLAEELLPTTSGFFFGSTDYDEYYFKDVEEVRDFIAKKLTKEFKDLDNGDSIYFKIWY